jgi:hypothetical protein
MAISDKNQKQMDEFITILSKMDIKMFLGTANLLGVSMTDRQILDDKGRPSLRTAEDMVAECVTIFANLNNKQRRDLMKILRRAVK